jgi:hypothetical protein
MKQLLSCLLIFLIFIDVQAQRDCATERAAKLFPVDKFGNPLSSDRSLRDTLPNELITIPVVVHVLYKSAAQNISDAQILSQIASLNADFGKLNTDQKNIPAPFKALAADSRIRFCLARVDPKGRPTTGIVRKYTNVNGFQVNDNMKFSSAGGDDAWDSKRYLNIWVCNLFGRTLGYATYPGGEAERDGVVIQFNAFGTTGNLQAPYNKGRTATHEVGHWLGLKHIWGDADCGSDEVGDTPPQKSYNTGCPLFPKTSNCSINPNGDMFMNYMDFSDDACMNMFTHGQKSRMRNVFAKNNLRNTFLQSFACDSSLAEDGPLPVDTVRKELTVTTYPNPVVSELTLQITAGSAEGLSIIIMNSIGSVMHKRIASAEQLQKLSFSGFAPGMYLLKIGEGKKAILKKIIKLL